LKKGYAASDTLASDIQGFVKPGLFAPQYPPRLAFNEDIPMTTTGKGMRRLLRERAGRRAFLVTRDVRPIPALRRQQGCFRLPLALRGRARPVPAPGRRPHSPGAATRP